MRYIGLYFLIFLYVLGCKPTGYIYNHGTGISLSPNNFTDLSHKEIIDLLTPDTVELKAHPLEDSINVEIIIGTFLGNDQRNYYGNSAPGNLDVVWKFNLGTGKTKVGKKELIWSGAGWTGQPLFIREDSSNFLIQGSYDHKLRKINASNGEVVWEYQFDDVIKGTASLWYNKDSRFLGNQFHLLQGSRQGLNKSFYDRFIPSYRAINYFTGKEYWRLNSELTRSYSRDVDGSALFYRNNAYIGLENGYFTILKADSVINKDKAIQPFTINRHLLYTTNDAVQHKGNVVTESSPARLKHHIYIASGSGHIYGYNMQTDKIDWDFYIGSDIDGSVIVTEDSSLLVSIEKQYIEGEGGAMKLDPSKRPEEAVVWYFPTQNNDFASWEGGIIGSIGVNDQTKVPGMPPLAAFIGIDGYLYVVNYRVTEKFQRAIGFDGQTVYPKPVQIFKYKVGPSISTPIFVGDKLIAASYNGIHLFSFDNEGNFKLLDKLTASFEATPIAVDGKIFIASRNGYLYCLGK